LERILFVNFMLEKLLPVITLFHGQDMKPCDCKGLR